MTDEEIKKLADEEIKKLADEIVKQKGGFYVDPEKHYIQHQRLDRILDLYDSASNIILKVVLGATILGVLALSALGVGLFK